MNSTLKSFSSLQKKENSTKADQIWKVFGVYQKMPEKNQQQTDSFDNVGITQKGHWNYWWQRYQLVLAGARLNAEVAEAGCSWHIA